MEGYKPQEQFKSSFTPEANAWDSVHHHKVSMSTDNEKGITPGELFGHALLNCFLGTFKIVLRNYQIPYQKVEAELTLHTEKNPEGPGKWFSKAEIQTTLVGANDSEKVQSAFEKANAACYVRNSVKTIHTNKLILQ